MILGLVMIIKIMMRNQQQHQQQQHPCQPNYPRQDLYTTTAPATDNAVYRLGRNPTAWACKNCKIKADKWFMQKHTSVQEVKGK